MIFDSGLLFLGHPVYADESDPVGHWRVNVFLSSYQSINYSINRGESLQRLLLQGLDRRRLTIEWCQKTVLRWKKTIKTKYNKNYRKEGKLHLQTPVKRCLNVNEHITSETVGVHRRHFVCFNAAIICFHKRQERHRWFRILHIGVSWEEHHDHVFVRIRAISGRNIHQKRFAENDRRGTKWDAPINRQYFLDILTRCAAEMMIVIVGMVVREHNICKDYTLFEH